MGARTKLLDRNQVQFVQGAVSATAASRGPQNTPAIARASGCRVSADRNRVSIFLAASQSAPLLAAVRASGTVAVVFSEPSTHRTIQIKSSDALIEAIRPGDAAHVERYIRAFANEVGKMGHDEAFVRALFWCEPGDIVRLTFTPHAAFDQTPGPRAGAPIGAP